MQRSSSTCRPVKSPHQACCQLFSSAVGRQNLRFFFFFNDTATTEIYTLSLHDALPISSVGDQQPLPSTESQHRQGLPRGEADRKSTRLNSSHGYISYAVFCLKKKKKHPEPGAQASAAQFPPANSLLAASGPPPSGARWR